MDKVVALDIPKCYNLYNFPLKLEKSLSRFGRADDYISRAPRPKERLPESNPCEIVMCKDIIDSSFRFHIHPFFVTIFNDFTSPPIW